MIMIKKRDGREEQLDIRKIQKFTGEAVEGLKNVSQSELEVDAQIKFQNGMTTEDIQQALIMTAVDKIDIDSPDWSFVAARLFLYDLYHRVTGFTGYDSLEAYFLRCEKENKILKGLKEHYDLEDLNNYIKPERDLQFTYLGIKTGYDRYMIKDSDGNPLELPQHMFMAIAMFLAHKEENKQEWAKKFYDVLSKFEVMVATPTLSGARKPRHQLSSCFPKGHLVSTVNGEKNIEDIVKGDMVLTDKNRFKSVVNTIKHNYKGDLYTLDINGLGKDYISATEEHPFEVIKQNKTICIRKGGKCVPNKGKYEKCFKKIGEYANDCKKLIDPPEEPTWVKISEVRKGDLIKINFCKEVHNVSNIETLAVIGKENKIRHKRKILVTRTIASMSSGPGREFINFQVTPINAYININDDFMEFMGYYVGEGYINYRNAVVFSVDSKDTILIKRIFELANIIFGVKGIITDNKDGSTRIAIHSILVVDFMLEIIGTGHSRIELPNLITKYKDTTPFIRALLRCNGHVGRSETIIALTNKKLINQLFSLCLRAGLSPRTRDVKIGNNKRSFAKALYLLNSIDYEFINTILEGDKLEDLKKGNSSSFWYNGNYYCSVTENTKTDFNGDVYNLEVEEDNTYTVNNLSVHNCYLGSSPDNIEGIFDSFKEMGILSKFGGGIGWDWTQIRGIASTIDDTKGVAGGVVPEMRILNDVMNAFDQLG